MKRLSKGVAIFACCLLGFLDFVHAQEIDAVIVDNNREPFSVVDQITDPMQRQSLLSLLEQANPQERAKQAEAFLIAYPQSAFLSQVYEIAAKSYIDLGDYARALKHSRDSLRLLPENPVLLVPLASVQVHENQISEAKQSARQALSYLDQFSRPSAISESSWSALERQLRASSHYVLGQAAALEASEVGLGPRRTELLQDSEKFLLQARRLNPTDPEIAYLAGLTCSWLGKTEEAVGNFAAAYRQQGPMQSRALQELRRIYESRGQLSRTSFEQFLKEFSTEKSDTFAIASSETHSALQPLSDYAGTEACRMCHVIQHEAWLQTGMARMFRPYRPANVIGDFSQSNEFYAGDEVYWENGKVKVVVGEKRFLFARMLTEGGRHFFEMKQSDGQWHRFPVDFTIGSKWQQAYATRLPNGRIHVFPIQYNLPQKRWINFWKVIDPPESERANLFSWKKLTTQTTYAMNCAVCHTSQLQNVKGLGFQPDNLEFREPGINCEMCHGPSAGHVAAMRQGKPYVKQPLDPPVAFDRISSQDYVAICAQCHMQSALRKPGLKGELNYFREGGLFFQRYKSRPFTEFSQKAFYKDGRFRETSFIVESLLRSACFKKGQVNCGHCHDPHGTDSASNKNSLKFVDQPDQMCLQCHSGYLKKVELHTRHSAASEASRCRSCHMPRIMRSLLFNAGTHHIDDIPSAEMTLRFGQEESPNACLLCHSNKNSQWLMEQLPAWKKADRGVRPTALGGS